MTTKKCERALTPKLFCLVKMEKWKLSSKRKVFFLKEMKDKNLPVINIDLETLLCTIFHNGMLPRHLSFSLIDRLHTETGMLLQ